MFEANDLSGRTTNLLHNAHSTVRPNVEGVLLAFVRTESFMVHLARLCHNIGHEDISESECHAPSLG